MAKKRRAKTVLMWAAFKRFLGLLVLLAVIGVGVWALVAYHYNTPSPFQNELFFGPMAEPEPEPETTSPAAQ